MNKQEKQLAAYYIAQCMNDMRIAGESGDDARKARAESDYKRYTHKLRELLTMKFEMFCTDYNKTVSRPMNEVLEMAIKMYSNIVNGLPAF